MRGVFPFQFRFKSVPTSDATPLLKVNNIEVVYDHVILVLKGVSLQVPTGGIVTLLGANGAGKSTTLKAISHLLRAERGEVTKGGIEFEGKRLPEGDPSRLVKAGTGAYTRGDGRGAVREDLQRVYQYFPRLLLRRSTQTGYISGGEQQMVAIGRALMARPKLILLDEPSMGLAPQLVKEIFSIIGQLNSQEKVSILLAEQNATQALKVAQYAYVLENGRVVLDGDAETIRGNEDVREFYLGLTAVGKKSYRDVKHYRRRKRWLA